MEVVRDLSLEKILTTLRWFSVSQGLSQIIISDNAALFKPSSEALTDPYCMENKTTLIFIPELALLFRRFYERMEGLNLM